ncbi:MAG: hypothetical protein M3Q07_11170 [Pseudobdellovibrionaceae bacterium]|nr:hypothetical protein [Pseudobdellovibrionaceae bacterium]
MANKAPKKKRDAKEIAEPVRSLLVELLKEQLKTTETKNRVAKVLGKSPSTLNSLLYQGKGGFDLIVSALIVAMQIDEDFLLSLRDRFRQEVQGGLPISDVDARWKALDKWIDEDEKGRWLSAIEAYVGLEKPKS